MADSEKTVLTNALSNLNISDSCQLVIEMDRRKRLLGKVRGPGDRRVGRLDRRKHRSVFRIVFIPWDRLIKQWANVRLF
jgi:hypothetical protein